MLKPISLETGLDEMAENTWKKLKLDEEAVVGRWAKIYLKAINTASPKITLKSRSNWRHSLEMWATIQESPFKEFHS